MTHYADLIEQRFGDAGPSGDGVTNNELIRRVIARTIRSTRPGKPIAPTIMILLCGRRTLEFRGAPIRIGGFWGKLLKFSS